MKSAYQSNLYNNLMALTASGDTFYHKDQVLDGITYRVFSYRLASWTEFQLPSAIECRGIMFRLDLGGNPEELVAHPMQKFFNDGEGGVVHDYSMIDEAMLKMDGSLISTFIHNGNLHLKSKTSLSSEHCINATKWLYQPEQLDLLLTVKAFANLNYTVNMEYTSPEPNMRIVIGYEKPSLTILNVRDNTNGSYVSSSVIRDVLTNYGVSHEHYVGVIEGHLLSQQWVTAIDAMTGIEGYVIRLVDGTMVKVKTAWYRALHFTKDSVNNPRRLYEAVLDETTDDLRGLFHDDHLAIAKIEEMEQRVCGLYNALEASVESYWTENKSLDRKSYAILGQQKLGSKEFSLAMLRYTGKEFTYRDMMRKWYKEYGFVDANVSAED